MSVMAIARELTHIDAQASRTRIDADAQGLPAPASVDLAASLNVLTCGSVDDGKSTLIGRLLWDTDGLHADQRARVERSPRTAAGTPDFSLLVDGLAAEREQGITIDIAWRYLDAESRRLVIIDSPGHEQYTRNMATGATHADVAILLVDARSGVKEQTRRHAAILDLMGVSRVVLAVNKMDLVDWSEERFADIRAEFGRLADRFGFDDALAIPVSAVFGDNIARRSSQTPWYTGPSLLEHLGRIPSRSLERSAGFRFPVQFVVRAGQDFRGLAGTVASGSVGLDDEIVEPVSGRRARVRCIVTMGADLTWACEGQAVVLELDVDLDISRGAVLSKAGQEPAVARSLEVRLVWLADEPMAADRGYLLRTATDLIPISGLHVRAHLDLDSLEERPGNSCITNDIALGRLDLGRSASVDRFAEHLVTGSFILVDPISGASVAGGVVVAVHERNAGLEQAGGFRLTRDVIARGLGADLKAADRNSDAELRRRANEVAILLRAAGVSVELEDAWPRVGENASVVGLWLMLAFSFGLVGAVLLGVV